MYEELIEAARQVEARVIEWRRRLHEIPELRWEEEQTISYIRSLTREVSDKKIASSLRWRDEFTGGLVVDMVVDDHLDMILLRADVDALPIQEATGKPFASRTPGLMHACGHDIHSAMLLGAYQVLTQGYVRPRRNIRFVWQRAEENPVTESGGHRLVTEGVCHGVSSVHGLHVSLSGTPGAFSSRPGAMMANSDRLKIVVRTEGGHVAHPQHGTNAIDVAVDICSALRGFDTRSLGPLEPVSLVPAILHSGTASNIRPSEAEVWFAVRNFLPPDERHDFFQRLEKRVRAISSVYPGAVAEVTPIEGQPSLHNTPEDVDIVSELLRGASQTVEISKPLFAGEDFSYYLQQRTGSYWKLGAFQEGSGDLHTPTYNPDEAQFWRGVLFWLLLATAEGGNTGRLTQ